MDKLRRLKISAINIEGRIGHPWNDEPDLESAQRLIENLKEQITILEDYNEAYATQKVTEALKEAAEKIDKKYWEVDKPFRNEDILTGLDYAETIVRDLIPKQEQKQALKDVMKMDEENGIYDGWSKEADDNQNQ